MIKTTSLPLGWKNLKLKSVLQRVRTPVRLEADTLYREIGIRSHGKGIFHKEERTGASIGNKSVFWIEPDCFVVNIVFAWEQAIAKTTTDEMGMIASHRFPMYKPRDGKLDLDFLVYFFKTPYGKRLLGLASPGGAGRNKTLGQEAFLDLAIPLPPFAEQRAIAAILGTWDKAIALTERRIAAAEQRKQALMQQLLTGRVRFPEFVGEAWQKITLRQALDIQYGKSPNSIRDEAGVYNIYGTGGIVGKTNKPLYDKPAIIIGRKGTIDQPQLAKEPFWAIDTTYYGVPQSKIDVDWIYYTLSYLNLERYNEASGVPSLSRNTLYSIKIMTPSIEEQRRIAAILNACDRELDLLRRKRDALQVQKKGLMQRLLTGHVRVKA